jgi:hypothetical protein
MRTARHSVLAAYDRDALVSSPTGNGASFLALSRADRCGSSTHQLAELVQQRRKCGQGFRSRTWSMFRAKLMIGAKSNGFVAAQNSLRLT